MNLVTVDLGDEIIARIDALATRRGITRDELLVTLVNSGLEVEEGALLRALEEREQSGEHADCEPPESVR
jgi:hypothetical protein